MKQEIAKVSSKIEGAERSQRGAGRSRAVEESRCTMQLQERGGKKKGASYPDIMVSKMSPYCQSRNASHAFPLPPRNLISDEFTPTEHKM